MNVGARFILDAGILPYSADRDAGDRQDRARDPVGRAAKRDCVLTIQALAEFFQATAHEDLLQPAQARAFVNDWLHPFDVVAAHDRSITEAMDAVEEHRLPFRDAMLSATARHAGRTTIVTERMQDGRRLNGFSLSARSPPIPMGAWQLWSEYDDCVAPEPARPATAFA